MLEELGEINRNKITEKLSGIFEPVLERECMCERCRRERSTRLTGQGKAGRKTVLPVCLILPQVVDFALLKAWSLL